MTLFLMSVALGLVKGFLEPESAGEATGFSFEEDVWAPAKEELLYRAGPLWAFPNLPYGSTAVVFAADHVLDDFADAKRNERVVSPSQAIARLGDVFFGGLIYESAYRQHGLASAIAAHAAHNAALALGAKVRRRAA